MRKPKIQPPTPSKRRILGIGCPLLLRHGVPHAIARLVAPHVVALGGEEDKYDKDVDGDEVLVAFFVQGLVAFLVDVGGGDASGLDGHLEGRGVSLAMGKVEGRGERRRGRTLYRAAETERTPTLLELREVQPTRIASVVVRLGTFHRIGREINRKNGGRTSIGIRCQHRDQGVCSPLVHHDPWPPAKGDQTRQRPERLQQ